MEPSLNYIAAICLILAGLVLAGVIFDCFRRRREIREERKSKERDGSI